MATNSEKFDFQDEKLLALNFEQIKKILEESKEEKENNKEFKIKMFNFVISWVEDQLQIRKKFLLDLLNLLPLYELPFEFLSKIVPRNTIVNNSLQCLKLLSEAIDKSAGVSSSNIVYESSHSQIPRLFFLGGWDENENETLFFSISKLSTNTIIREWKSFSGTLKASRHFGATVIGTKIYICGGKSENGEISKELKMFDCEKNISYKLRVTIRTAFGSTVLLFRCCFP